MMKNTTLIKELTLEQFQKIEKREQFLRKTIDKLSNQLEKEKHRNYELLKTVENACKESASALILPKIKTPVFSSKLTGTEEQALILISDWQLGKITRTYNSKVCENRASLFTDKIISITEVQRHDHPVKKARIFLLGDIIEGEGIFKTQSHQLDSSMLRQIMVDGPRILSTMIYRLLSYYEEITLICVPGNHGRVSFYHNPETNGDRMLYLFLKAIFQNEPRVKFVIPYERNASSWYTVDYPFHKKQGILAFHGHQIKGSGFAGFPWYGLGRRINNWRSGSIPEPFAYAFFGHWHTTVRVRLNQVTAYGNGTTESSNEYAQEELAAAGFPSQMLMYIHPTYGITAEYEVRLG